VPCGTPIPEELGIGATDHAISPPGRGRNLCTQPNPSCHCFRDSSKTLLYFHFHLQFCLEMGSPRRRASSIRTVSELRRFTTDNRSCCLLVWYGMVWCPSYPLDRNRCDQVVAAVPVETKPISEQARTKRTQSEHAQQCYCWTYKSAAPVSNVNVRNHCRFTIALNQWQCDAPAMRAPAAQRLDAQPHAPYIHEVS
jgi:hypothetical protein